MSHAKRTVTPSSILNFDPLSHEKPLASPGLTSYRFRGTFGWVMIGATDHHDALREAGRSTTAPLTLDRLQVWDAETKSYKPVPIMRFVTLDGREVENYSECLG